LSYRLESLGGGGVALLSRPGFVGWVTQADSARCVSSLTVDECGRVFWIHRHDCRLYRLDPASGLVEAMIPLAECGGDGTALFGRLIAVSGRLWIVDRSRSRLIALRPDTFQIIAEVRLPGPIDLAAGGNRLVSLDGERVRTFDLKGRELGSRPRERMVQPLAVGADPKGEWIYVLDSNARHFLRFDATGTLHDEIGAFDDVGDGFAPRLLAVHPEGNLFVSDGSAAIHDFAPDGGYVGNVGGLSALTAVSGLAFNPDGQLYVGSPSGIAGFGSEAGLAGNAGQFYSGSLDNGAQADECWHRLDLTAELDAGGAIDVWYASSQEKSLADVVGAILERESTPADKAAALEGLLGDRWIGPHQLRSPAATSEGGEQAPESGFRVPTSDSLLFKWDTKRYLWLKLQLSGLAPRARAAVREMRIYYPRLSYLRYLPAVYQQDRPSREFLERFLSLFETVFSDLEATVERIPELFDPGSTPSAFLDWLAQWLDLAVEEDWDPKVKKALIANAARLYERKGTPAGLADFIEIVLQQRPLILEAFETEQPLGLGQGGHLGRDTRLESRSWEAVPRNQRTILDGSSALGTSRLRPSARVPVDPYRAAAYRFTLVLRLSPPQLQRHRRALDRIIRENSPAHVGYDLVIQPGARLGAYSAVGLNLRVDDPQPVHLGHSALGWSICARPTRYGPELEIDTTLTGPDHEWRRASACS